MTPPESRATRILAVDFGDRRTGLAATDPTGTIVVPLEPLVGLDDAGCAAAIAALARERDAQAVVLGLPLSAEGSRGPRAKRTLAFAARLGPLLPCPLVTVDESHSTDEAHALLKAGGMKAARRKRVADSIAAMVILERYRGPTRKLDS
ncbi:MAG: Holliday junction resolvase RuvX [Planctomycetes bacterium]|nr:Holliday junction resolvase RuvX [Planctomycetota bacterium]